MGEPSSKFHVWEKNAATAQAEITRHVSDMGNTIRRQAQELADLQVMYGTLCLHAKEMGMKEVPLENPRMVQDGMHEFRARMHTALELFEQWEDLDQTQKGAILDILFPNRGESLKLNP